MTFLVETPSTRSRERDYILSVIFKEFWGLEHHFRPCDRGDVRISTSGSGRELILPDGLFATRSDHWLKTESLPTQGLDVLDIRKTGLDCRLVSPVAPMIYGEAGGSFSCIEGERITLPLDIFGSIFFMLTRYEEVADERRDQQGRFPASASLAFREGFLHRPIVNEYLEILWACLKRLWPGLSRKLRQYRPILTHDVDSAACGMNYSLPQFFKACIGDVIKRRSIKLAKRRCMSRVEASRDRYDNDPFNTFDFIMDCSERYGLNSAFFFICGVRPEVINSHYDPKHPWIKNLIKRIHERGHELGWHPGYGTYKDLRFARDEYIELLKIYEELGVDPRKMGGRQHGLQWEIPTTWRIWSQLGLSYDSSLNFAEYPGFRCGVCYEYTVFDLLKRKVINLKERPLIAMDTSYSSYLRYNFKETYGSVSTLSNNCKLFNGDFVSLWHNNNLISDRQKRNYREIVELIQ